jgi:threonine aldolase
MIDLRSDTVTKPTPGMRAAMAAAEVGDDVHDEDPSIHRLQARVAQMLGKEAALFVPSGTMSNQIGIRVHTRPGDELLCEETNHIYLWEAGAPAVLSGVTCRTFVGDNGVLELAQLEHAIKPSNDHYVRTRLVCLENTHNRGGGRIYPLATIRAISAWAKQHDLIMHLDGARLWNAAVASGISLATWAEPFDSVSVCFSKGLGAPVGSALVGSRAFIAQAKRVRKLLGGGMRQAGVLAAAVLYALDHHFERLADDHRHAQMLADAVRATPGLRLVPERVETNLVWIETDPALGPAKAISTKLCEQGVQINALGPRHLRACTHLDVSARQAEQAADILQRTVRALPTNGTGAAACWD